MKPPNERIYASLCSHNNIITIAKMWKLLSVHQQIMKIWYTFTRENYSAMKKEDVAIVTVWLDLEDMLTAINQARNTNTIWFHLYVSVKNPSSQVQHTGWWSPQASVAGWVKRPKGTVLTNEETIYRMGRNMGKWCDWQGLNFQNTNSSYNKNRKKTTQSKNGQKA